MTRLGVLRAGYGALGFAFAGLAGSVYVPSLLLPALALAIAAGVLLAFSGDSLPKWAGSALLAYFAFTVLVFIAATPITIDKGDGYFVNSSPTEIAQEGFEWMILAAPLMLVGAGVLASWEREVPARVLLLGALAGFLVVAALSIMLVPDAADAGQRQGDLTRALFALSAAAGAAGAIWAAGRADEYA